MKPKELVDIISDITTKGKDTLSHFIQNAEKCNHVDRGVEGWFQTELIAELEKKGETVSHFYGGPDIIFKDCQEIELKMTTCFNPGWTIDGMINHKAPVLFFSGYLNFYKGKTNPDFDDEGKIKEWFRDRLTERQRNELKSRFGKSGLNIMYRTVDMGNDKAMVGYIEPSEKVRCQRI